TNGRFAGLGIIEELVVMVPSGPAGSSLGPPRSRRLTIPRVSDDIPRSTDGVIALSDDHHRPADVVKDGLRDTSQQKAAERAQPSGSENDEVDIAAARAPNDR